MYINIYTHMDAFTDTALAGTAFTGAAYIHQCKKPSQALPCLGKPAEAGSLAAGMCKCERRAPFFYEAIGNPLLVVDPEALHAS